MTHTERVRMNDYVGPPLMARVTWDVPCTKREGRHILGLMSHVCVTCQAKPTIEYERSAR